MGDDIQRLHAMVSGRVQGVNFRHYTILTARELGLSGWVRNRDDGTVEVLAEGGRPALDRLLAFLRKGPPAARVTGVQHEWMPASGEFAHFSVRY